MAASGPTDKSRSRNPWWWIVAGLLALLMITGLVILWIKAPNLYGTGNTAKTATATTRGGILTVAAAFIAATAAGAGLYFTAHSIRVNQQALLETERANRETDRRGRLTLRETERANREADRRDRYAKAIEQLGHDKAPVRLGAMYSLERLAQDNVELRQAVVDVLCAYLRMPFKPPQRYEPDTESRAEGTEDPSPADATDQEPERTTAQEELLVRQTAQRLIAVHLRRPSGTSGVDAQDIEASPEVTFWPDISLDLTEASLVNLDLSNAFVLQAEFQGAAFFGETLFRRATFSHDAMFSGATFSDYANFHEAIFSRETSFAGATFFDVAHFTGATLCGGASFWDATFNGDAIFFEAKFSGTTYFVASFFSRDALFGKATFSEFTSFFDTTFGGRTLFEEATFAHGVMFHGATFAVRPSFEGMHILHLDRIDLQENRVWPDGWTVRADAGDSARGTLVSKP